jgi:hypothetical protein
VPNEHIGYQVGELDPIEELSDNGQRLVEVVRQRWVQNLRNVASREAVSCTIAKQFRVSSHRLRVQRWEVRVGNQRHASQALQLQDMTAAYVS